jgi:hypothetical protein
MSADRELLELAAKAAGYRTVGTIVNLDGDVVGLTCKDPGKNLPRFCFSPLTDDGDRLRLARQLGINIDFSDCCAWKRLPGGGLIQEFWGGDCGDEAHAVLSVAAQIGKAMP